MLGELKTRERESTEFETPEPGKDPEVQDHPSTYVSGSNISRHTEANKVLSSPCQRGTTCVKEKSHKVIRDFIPTELE